MHAVIYFQRGGNGFLGQPNLRFKRLLKANTNKLKLKIRLPLLSETLLKLVNI